MTEEDLLKLPGQARYMTVRVPNALGTTRIVVPGSRQGPSLFEATHTGARSHENQAVYDPTGFMVALPDAQLGRPRSE